MAETGTNDHCWTVFSCCLRHTDESFTKWYTPHHSSYTLDDMYHNFVACDHSLDLLLCPNAYLNSDDQGTGLYSRECLYNSFLSVF